jgi:hypothetical protein
MGVHNMKTNVENKDKPLSTVATLCSGMVVGGAIAAMAIIVATSILKNK